MAVADDCKSTKTTQLQRWQGQGQGEGQEQQLQLQDVVTSSEPAIPPRYVLPWASTRVGHSSILIASLETAPGFLRR